MAIVYRNGQPGAPAAYSTAAYSAAQFDAFKGVLKACLVTGYGATPAAGWELIAEGQRYLVLRNGTHTGYVCFTWLTGGTVRIYLADTFSGVDGNDVIIGDGRKTGVAANNATAHAIGLTYFSFSAARASWFLIADRKSFVFSWVSNSSDSLLTNATTINYPCSIYVGEDSGGGFLAMGGQASNTASASQNGYFSGDPGAGFTALKNPETGLLVDSGALSVHTPGLPLATALPSDNSVDTRLLHRVDLGKAAWFGGDTVGGQLRGIALVPQLASTRFTSDAAEKLGFGPSRMVVSTGSTPVDLSDPYTYFVRLGCPYNPMFLITDNPEFWP